MFDNGLLKYYTKRVYKGGILDARDIGLRDQTKQSFNVYSCITNDGRFFKRVSSDKKLDKRITDSQVLLSQIYNRVGLQSAVYLPAQMKGKKFLLSNSVLSPETVLASDHIESVPHYQHRFPMDFLNPRHTGEAVQKYFTERALMQQTKMRVYDTASYNNDRHYANFFYRITDGKADDVVGIDFEMGTCAFDPSKVKSDEFYNDFDEPLLPRREMLGRFREDEKFAETVDKLDLAEEIGSINPIAVAQEIKETIGYEIDPKITDILAKSYDEVAETLIQ